MRAALASMLRKRARLRFRDVPPDSATRIESASKADLERWLERILTAETLDDVIAQSERLNSLRRKSTRCVRHAAGLTD